jgi:hypothetical protein
VSKPLTAAQLRALEPRYTVGGLFESGKLGAAEEAALEEIKQIRDSFTRYVNPSRGWMTPRYSDSRPAMPRQMGNGPAWRRYKEWRLRWSTRLVPPNPGRPWGMTVADMVVAMAVEPVHFADFAALTGKSAISMVDLFIRSVQDYGAPPRREANMGKLWRKSGDAYQQARLRPSRRLRRRLQQQKRREASKFDTHATLKE